MFAFGVFSTATVPLAVKVVVAKLYIGSAIVFERLLMVFVGIKIGNLCAKNKFMSLVFGGVIVAFIFIAGGFRILLPQEISALVGGGIYLATITLVIKAITSAFDLGNGGVFWSVIIGLIILMTMSQVWGSG
jgi:hypothetical protein